MKIDELRQAKADASEQLCVNNASLKKQLQETRDALQTALQAKDPPRAPKVTTKLKASHRRVFVGDLHGYYQDAAAVDAFIADMKKIQPAVICLLGDMLDCGGFLAEHQTLGFVAEGEYSFADDVRATADFLDRLQKACPNTAIDYLEGNHEQRIEKWCITKALRSPIDASALYNLFNPVIVLGLEARGIDYIRQSEFADGVSIRGTKRYGTDHVSVFATHGITTCKHAAARHVERFGGNIVYGHTHRADSYIINTVASTVIGAWSPGCLCERVRLWNHNQPDNWTTGYHLQLVAKSGLFQPINVHLVKGQSMIREFLT